MAKLKNIKTLSPHRLRRALTQGLAVGGIQATARIEHIQGLKLHRVLVTAKEFDKLEPSERQNLVWRIIDKEFSAEEQLQITMVLTLTPDELNGK